MDLETIRQYASLMAECGLDELELKEKGVEIRLSMKSGHVSRSTSLQASAPEEKEVQEAPAPEAEYITSPLVGTFYRSSSPEGAPFITEGSKVEQGTVLCIIEAMKVMNEIKAEKSGVITKILIENASPVEYGQKMFEIQA